MISIPILDRNLLIGWENLNVCSWQKQNKFWCKNITSLWNHVFSTLWTLGLWNYWIICKFLKCGWEMVMTIDINKMLQSKFSLDFIISGTFYKHNKNIWKPPEIIDFFSVEKISDFFQVLKFGEGDLDSNFFFTFLKIFKIIKENFWLKTYFGHVCKMFKS